MKKQIFVFLVMAFYTSLAAADGAISRAIPTAGANSGATTSRTTTDMGTTRTVTRTTAPAENTDVQKNNTSIVRSGARAINLTGDNTATPTVRTNATTISRSRSLGASQSQSSAQANLAATVATSGRNSRVDAASMNSNSLIRRAGITLRPTTAEVGGRAIINGTNTQTGSNITSEVRSLQSRAATNTATTRETIAEAKERLEQTADLNKSCQEQYNDCMDQFCAVIDANQKRCSCSANLSRYTKVEDAVKDANTKLNDVAQRIRYVGLSADEIRAIMTETEAEEALSGKTDTSETRNMLAQIEKMIKDPTSSASYNSDTSIGLDMDLDFTSDNFADMFSLDFLNTGTTSFSNLRGTELYNAAKKRCNTVLNQCKNAGGTPQQITGNYDLAIDKDCIAYENGLKKMNDTLLSNVRSANLMLQKARLAVLQNKNQYDAKGCVAALETCMTDDMVCGEDYSKCIDPTKKYINENGEVVLGQNITYITNFMQKYNNAAIDRAYVDNISNSNWSISVDRCATNGSVPGNDGSCVVKYLIQKIGTGAKATDNGLCRPVLDKCQYYTYDSDKKYKKDNDIVVNYIQRAMVNIQAAQQKIISDYASSCMVDVATCYNQQVTQVNTWSSSASANSVYRVMNGACYNVALTCAYAVFADGDKLAALLQIIGTTDAASINFTGSGHPDASDYIKAISEMFYQSLLCPDNSEFQPTAQSAADSNGANAGYVNTRCKCKTGYTVWGGQCVLGCGTGYTRDQYGTCSLCAAGYEPYNGTCAKQELQIPTDTPSGGGGSQTSAPSSTPPQPESSSGDESGEPDSVVAYWQNYADTHPVEDIWEELIRLDLEYYSHTTGSNTFFIENNTVVLAENGRDSEGVKPMNYEYFANATPNSKVFIRNNKLEVEDATCTYPADNRSKGVLKPSGDGYCVFDLAAMLWASHLTTFTITLVDGTEIELSRAGPHIGQAFVRQPGGGGGTAFLTWEQCKNDMLPSELRNRISLVNGYESRGPNHVDCFAVLKTQ